MFQVMCGGTIRWFRTRRSSPAVPISLTLAQDNSFSTGQIAQKASRRALSVPVQAC